ncbi:MAG: hypothetical protein JWN04_4 [Myxococcaceae bacterium]|nr:hypothetical protein [Myxococcaceae bacterium]
MDEQSGYKWQGFGADGPPANLIAGWRMLLGLPRGAQQNLWHLIPVGLLEPETAEHRQLLENYAMRFEANPAHVMGAVRACQYALRHSAANNIEQDPLMADLRFMSAGNAAGVELLMARFSELKTQLRLRLLEDTLADHGNVLVAFDWRIDSVSASNHGEMESVPVVFLNLAYRNGETVHKLPIQLTPSAVVSLKTFLDRFETE